MPKKGYRKPRVKNKCMCGEEYEVLESVLNSGGGRYCSPVCKKNSKLNLIGIRFGRQVVISEGEKNNGRRTWACLCDCGNIHSVITNVLNRGVSNSCGCLRVETSTILNTTHGCSNNRKNFPEYHVRMCMKDRCYNKNNDRYADWGGRGIKVCDRWLESFENFLDDMGRRPSPNHSIERRDNDKDYCPENCYWATKSEQNRNTRWNRYLEYGGRRMVITDWAKELMVSRATISKHLKKKPFSEVVEFYKNQTSGAWYEKRRQRFSAAMAS